MPVIVTSGVAEVPCAATVTVTSLAKNFLDNQTIHTVALMEQETARLMAGK